MSDLALSWDSQVGAADLSVAANDLAAADDLENAVMLSVFLDREAEEGDELPDTHTDRRGWWADAHPVVAGDRIGSRQWLLAREKQTEETRIRAEGYVREALEWLTEDRVAESVEVEAEWIGRGTLGIAITIQRPKVDAVTYRWNYAWAAQEARR